MYTYLLILFYTFVICFIILIDTYVYYIDVTLYLLSKRYTFSHVHMYIRIYKDKNKQIFSHTVYITIMVYSSRVDFHSDIIIKRSKSKFALYTSLSLKFFSELPTYFMKTFCLYLSIFSLKIKIRKWIKLFWCFTSIFIKCFTYFNKHCADSLLCVFILLTFLFIWIYF